MKSGWKKHTLADVCVKITDGSHNPPKGGVVSDFPMLSSRNINNSKVSFEKTKPPSTKDSPTPATLNCSLAKETRQTLLKTKVKNKRYITFINYGKHSNDERMFLVDLVTGDIEKYLVSHGKMSDKNELIGYFFNMLTSGLTLGNYKNNIPEDHKYFKSATYLTSWSFTEDDIALWSLYSHEGMGVQIKANFEELKNALHDFTFKNLYSKAYNLEPNDPQILIRAFQFGNVKYKNIQDEFERYSSKNKELTRFSSENYDKENFSELLQAKRAELEFTNFDPRKHYLIKDNRYKHEKEIRGVLQICRRDGRTAEEYNRGNRSRGAPE